MTLPTLLLVLAIAGLIAGFVWFARRWARGLPAEDVMADVVMVLAVLFAQNVGILAVLLLRWAR